MAEISGGPAAGIAVSLKAAETELDSLVKRAAGYRQAIDDIQKAQNEYQAARQRGARPIPPGTTFEGMSPAQLDIKAIGISKFVTPFTPLTCDFGEISKTRWFSMVRMYAMDAVVLYLQMTSKFPSWTPGVRVPSPALCFQGASAILTPFPAAKTE
jgi:hypothetical protein